MPTPVTQFHLAQVNIGRLVAPLTSPEIAGFVEALDPINAIADESPGFVWRLQTESGNATDLRAFEDDEILVNMSVWRSLEELRDFVYRSRHVEVLRRRREWFEKLAEVHMALWWVPAGEIPTIRDAEVRITLLRERGPSPDAFTFRTPFGPPGRAERGDPAIHAEFCLPFETPAVAPAAT